MKTFGARIIEFNRTLAAPEPLPEWVEVLNPFLQPEVRRIEEAFYGKYYNDTQARIFIFGINPGRHGSGLTGIPFTDPIIIENKLGIPNPLPKKPELSASFISDMITAYGGPELFYSHYYITALCPLGFTRNGLNLNYYDDKNLERDLENYMVSHIRTQLDFGTTKAYCICLGEGANFKSFTKLNQKYGFFKEIIPLPHPRFIMQYKRKQKEDFIQKYLEVMASCERGGD